VLVVVVHFMFAAMGNDSLLFPRFGFSCGRTVNPKSHPLPCVVVFAFSHMVFTIRQTSVISVTV
jgi:hypothetical protein